MARVKKNDIDIINELAEKKGLSYGQYVIREYTKRAEINKREISKDYLSVNDRIKHKINFPVYSGKTTLQAAAETDFDIRGVICGHPAKRNID